jgi:hypothetical protein
MILLVVFQTVYQLEPLNVQTHSCKSAAYIEDSLMMSEHVGKGKATPLQTLTGPEGSRRLRLPDFKTIGT